MARVLGMIAVLIVLLVGALLARHQIGGVHSAPPQVSASQAADLAAPDVSTPAQARRLTEQAQSDVNRQVEEQSKQVRQNLDSQTQ